MIDPFNDEYFMKQALIEARAAALFLALSAQRCGKPVSNDQNIENITLKQKTRVI